VTVRQRPEIDGEVRAITGTRCCGSPHASPLAGLRLLCKDQPVTAHALSGAAVLAVAIAASSASAQPQLTHRITVAPLGAPMKFRAYQGKTSAGYSATIAVRIYHPARISRLPRLPFTQRVGLRVCRANPQTDVAIPMAVILTNNTAGFSAPLELTVGGLHFNNDSLAEFTDGDVAFSDGTSSCSGADTGGELASFTFSSVLPHQTVFADFYVILRRYLFAAVPQGKRAAAARRRLQRRCQDAGPPDLSWDAGYSLVSRALGSRAGTMRCMRQRPLA
jgi:hypothetical protein